MAKTKRSSRHAAASATASSSSSQQQQQQPSQLLPTTNKSSCRLVLVRLALCTALFFLANTCFPVTHAQNSDDKGYLDRFTYQDETVDRGDGYLDYRPPDWNEIRCNEGNRLDECEGYNYKWHEGINCTSGVVMMMVMIESVCIVVGMEYQKLTFSSFRLANFFEFQTILSKHCLKGPLLATFVSGVPPTILASVENGTISRPLIY